MLRKHVNTTIWTLILAVAIVLPHTLFAQDIGSDITPIADARAAETDIPLTIEGMLTTFVTSNETDALDFFISDETGGIRVTLPADLAAALTEDFGLTRGATFRVSGTAGDINGDKGILVTAIQAIDAADLDIIPVHIFDSLADWNSDSPFMGSPVILRDVSLTDPSQWPLEKTGKDVTIDLSNPNGNSFSLHLPGNSALHPSDAPSGSFSMLGVLSNEDGTPVVVSGFLEDKITSTVTGVEMFRLRSGFREVTFSVDVSNILNNGLFNPGDGDALFVRGSFNDWSTTTAMSTADLVTGEFTQSWILDGPEGSSVEYKYYVHTSDGSDFPNAGWEVLIDELSGEPDGFLNRVLVLGERGVPMITDDIFSTIAETEDDTTVTGPPLPIQLFTTATGVVPGERFDVYVLVGSPEFPGKDLFGIGFVLAKDGGNDFAYESLHRVKMFDAIDLSNLLEFVDDTTVPGQLFVSYALTDKSQHFPEFGDLVRVTLRVSPDASPGEYVISTLNEEAVNSSGTYFDVTGDMITIQVLEGGLYPGDTNRDGIVDAFDVEPLSTWFLQEGPARSPRSIEWSPQPFTFWDVEAATFTDTNGDGIVDQNDLLPIGVNFGQTSPNFKSDHTASKIPRNEAPVAFELPALNQGEVVRYELVLGSEDYPMHEIRSITLNLGFNGDLMTLSKVQPTNWADDTTRLEFSMYDQNRALQSLSVARLSGAGTSHDAALLLTIQALENIAAGTKVTLERSSVTHETGKYFFPQFTFNALEITSAAMIELPGELALHQNFPNPFNPTTTVAFQLPYDQHVTLEVYNVMGQRIATLADGMMAAGQHSINFNASSLASGIYMYRLTTQQESLTRTMMLLK